MANREVKVAFLGDASQLKRATAEADTSVKNLGGSVDKLGNNQGFKKLSTAAAVGVAAIGAAAVGIGVYSVKMASDFEDANTRLKVALGNVGVELVGVQYKLGPLNDQMEKLGFNNIVVADAMAKGVTSTQDFDKAARNLTIAADLAREKNISLSEAMDAVDKAATGNLRPLKALAIDLPITATNADKLVKANEKLAAAQDNLNLFLLAYPAAADPANEKHKEWLNLSKAVADAQSSVNDKMSAGSDILQGLSDRLGGQAQEHAETFKGKIEALRAKFDDTAIAIGNWLIPVIMNLMTWLQNATAYVQAHKDAQYALIGVVGVLTASMLALATANIITAVSTIIAMGPYILIAVLIAAAAAQVGYFMSKLDQGNNKILGLLVILETLASGMSLTAQQLNFFARLWTDEWNAMAAVLAWIWNHTLGPIIDEIRSGIAAAGDALRGLAGVGGGLPFGIKIPGLAGGTSNWQGGPAWIAEHGPELVNLPRGTSVTPLADLGGFAGGGDIVIQVDGREIARAVRNHERSIA